MGELSLVTGGAGFIGSHLVDALVKSGRSVRVFDDFSTGLRANIAHHDGRIEVVEGSLTDPAAVARAVRGAGVVYHLGALASVARSVETPAVSHAACATGTLNLLDAARRVAATIAADSGVRPRTIVIRSSCAMPTGLAHLCVPGKHLSQRPDGAALARRIRRTKILHSYTNPQAYLHISVLNRI